MTWGEGSAYDEGAMKLALVSVAAFVVGCSVVGCSASSDSTRETTLDPASHATLSTETVATHVVHPLWDYVNHRLYVATCAISMPMPSDVDAAHESAECSDVTPAKIQLVDVLVLDARGRVVGDAVVEDRPGGGCVHVDLPSAPAGGTLRVLALVTDVPDTKSTKSTIVDFESVAIATP
jgi:hypothetical protein